MKKINLVLIVIAAIIISSCDVDPQVVIHHMDVRNRTTEDLAITGSAQSDNINQEAEKVVSPGGSESFYISWDGNKSGDKNTIQLEFNGEIFEFEVDADRTANSIYIGSYDYYENNGVNYSYRLLSLLEGY